MIKINVKEISDNIRKKLKAEIKDMGLIYKNKPTLAVIQVGHDSASDIYVRNKKRACEEIGIKFNLFSCEENVSTNELLELIYSLNKDKDTHGILVQLPLPKHIDKDLIIRAISPIKDVDGFTPTQSSKLYLNERWDRLEPCTAKGIVKIIESITDIEGKNIVVVGRSNIVGKPVANLLTEKNATVTLCHSKTCYMDLHIRHADIVVLATGQPRYFNSRYFYNNLRKQIIIDAGINRDSNGKLCGDLNVESLDMLYHSKNIYYTSVPGGVGIMTVTELLENTLNAFYMNILAEEDK